MNTSSQARQIRKSRVDSMHMEQLESIDFNKKLSEFKLNYTGGISVCVSLNSFRGVVSARVEVDGKTAYSIDSRMANKFHKELPAQIEKYSELFKLVYRNKKDVMELLQDEDPMIAEYALSALA